MKPLDLTGMVFGDLTALEISEKRNGKILWLCRCTCGAEKSIYATHLVRGNTKSCSTGGTHGFGKKTPGYLTWIAMRTRCFNKNHIAYEQYGGRGITVCERWRESFLNFYQDMGPRPDQMTLDRINGNGNYEPSNCRWATSKEQQNNMRSNQFVVVNGVRLTIAMQSERLGVNYHTLYSRLKRAGAI